MKLSKVAEYAQVSYWFNFLPPLKLYFYQFRGDSRNKQLIFFFSERRGQTLRLGIGNRSPFSLLHHQLHFLHPTLLLTLSYWTKGSSGIYQESRHITLIVSSQFLQGILLRNDAFLVVLTAKNVDIPVGSEERDSLTSDSALQPSQAIVTSFSGIKTAGSHADHCVIAPPWNWTSTARESVLLLKVTELLTIIAFQKMTAGGSST